jgi:hypothetical protein
VVNLPTRDGSGGPGITFKFRTNPGAERGKVAVSELSRGVFLVMAREELTDAQIVMAIARWCGQNEAAP